MLGGFQRVVGLARVGDDAHVIAFALHVGHADGDQVLAFGHVAAHGVNGLVLEHDDHVVLADGGLEQALGVVGR